MSIHFPQHLQGAQQSLARSGNNGNTLLAIAKYKQQIQNLQNQINAQQAIHIKQQQALQPNPHPAAAHINNTNNEYLRSHDSMTALQGNFSEMNLNKVSSQGKTEVFTPHIPSWREFIKGLILFRRFQKLWKTPAYLSTLFT